VAKIHNAQTVAILAQDPKAQRTSVCAL